MPTAYTNKVQDGSITEFADFAMLCARAFGACITLRDEPIDTPIPDEFKPSAYHLEELKGARETLLRLKWMTVDQKDAAARSANEAALAQWREHERRKDEARQRYEAMLAQANAWHPPTPDHQGLKDFMIQQLSDSIEWDCTPTPKPTPMNRDEWYEAAIRKAEWCVQYHEKEHRREIERAKRRTEWIRDLRRSLGK